MAAKKVLTGECVWLIKRRRRGGGNFAVPAARFWRVLPCFKPGRDYTIHGVGKMKITLCARHARLLHRSSFRVEVAR